MKARGIESLGVDLDNCNMSSEADIDAATIRALFSEQYVACIPRSCRGHFADTPMPDSYVDSYCLVAASGASCSLYVDCCSAYASCLSSPLPVRVIRCYVRQRDGKLLDRQMGRSATLVLCEQVDINRDQRHVLGFVRISPFK